MPGPPPPPPPGGPPPPPGPPPASAVDPKARSNLLNEISNPMAGRKLKKVDPSQIKDRSGAAVATASKLFILFYFYFI
jgi:hypothetical protein